MNKSGLIATVAERLNLSRKGVEKIVDLIFESMIEALKREERIEIRGVGSFTVKHYRPYTGRNPKTGVSISVGPKKLPAFKVGKELKERVDSL